MAKYHRAPKLSNRRILRWHAGTRSLVMLIGGLILLILGVLLGIAILKTIGIILLVIGAVLLVVGMSGHAVAGRRHWW